MAVSERLRLRALGGDWRRVAATGQRQTGQREAGASQPAGNGKAVCQGEKQRASKVAVKGPRTDRQVKRPPTTVRNVNVDGESEGLCVCE